MHAHKWMLALGYSRLKVPSPHRGCQSLLQNLPGNPDSKIVSKCGNWDHFCKIYLEIREIVIKFWNLVRFYQKYMEMWSKTVKIFWNSSPWNYQESLIFRPPIWGEGTFYLEEPIINVWPNAKTGTYNHDNYLFIIYYKTDHDLEHDILKLHPISFNF